MRAYPSRPVLVLALLCAAHGCEEQRRVPYIAPTLHNWPQPYEGQPRLTLHVFEVGSLAKTTGLLPRPGSKTRRRQRSVVAYVLEHPREGLVVIDTGLSHHLAEDAKDYLGGLLGMTVHTELHEGEDLPSQMRAANLKQEAVRWVILSILRFPQAGDIEAFAQARLVVSRTEHEGARQGGMDYVQREFDDAERWELVDFNEAEPLGTMPAAVDLFGDGSCMLLDARGPTEGNLAVLIRLASRPVLLAGDLAPEPRNLRYPAVPGSLHDRDAWWDRIWHLKRFQDLEPALLIVPGNDPDSIRTAALPEIKWHEFTPAPTP